MQYHWLNKNNNNDLIIFFAGWSFDYKPFECLECKDYDVLVFYDYNTLNFPQIDFSQYDNINLICWSMGVFIAYYLRDKLPACSIKIAVNGTPFPIDDSFGIPFRTFDLTLKYAATGLQGKFYQNVFSNEEFLKKYEQNPVERTIQNRVDELVSLDKFIKSETQSYDGKFYDRVIVGMNDKIIPVKNQLNCWQNIAVKLECGHFPFYMFDSWEEILKCK